MFESKFFKTKCAAGVAGLALALSASAQNLPSGESAAQAEQAVLNAAPAQVTPAPMTPAQVAPAAPALVSVAAHPNARISPSAAAIAVINERMSVMQAQLLQLELEARIEAKRAEIHGMKSAGAPILDDGFAPTVLEIGGIDGNLTASLVVPGGNVQIVRVGDAVNGWTVRHISVNALTLAKGKTVKRLAFGSSPTSSTTPAEPRPQSAGFVSATPARNP
jgi:hypothetical protein